jgi:hypothetical protein
MVLAQRFAIPPRYMKFIARFRLEGLGAFVALLASLLMYFNALIFSFKKIHIPSLWILQLNYNKALTSRQ